MEALHKLNAVWIFSYFFSLSIFWEANFMLRPSVVRMPIAAEILSATLIFFGSQNSLHAQDNSA